MVSHTLFSGWLVLPSVWHVCLPFSNIANSCHYDIRLIPICASDKDAVIFATDTLSRGSGIAVPINLVQTIA